MFRVSCVSALARETSIQVGGRCEGLKGSSRFECFTTSLMLRCGKEGNHGKSQVIAVQETHHVWGRAWKVMPFPSRVFLSLPAVMAYESRP